MKKFISKKLPATKINEQARDYRKKYRKEVEEIHKIHKTSM